MVPAFRDALGFPAPEESDPLDACAARVLAPIRGTRDTAPVQPETQYARSGEVHIAYQVVGEGKLDLVWIPSLAHHVELSWENPPVARFLL